MSTADFQASCQSYREALNALLNAADYEAAGGDPSNAMPASMKQQYQQQLWRHRDAIAEHAKSAAETVSKGGGDPTLVYELVEYTKNYGDRRFYDVLAKVYALFSSVDAQNRPAESDQQVHDRVNRLFLGKCEEGKSHGDIAKEMATISAEDWRRYREVASKKAKISSSVNGHFLSRSKVWRRKKKNSPK